MSATADARRINLALQGGGAHGAFTWGVLDALLEDGRLRFEAISGTSAGAINSEEPPPRPFEPQVRRLRNNEGDFESRNPLGSREAPFWGYGCEQ